MRQLVPEPDPIVVALAARRRALRMTQRALAAAMDTHPSVVSELETGAVPPMLSTVRRYATAVGVDLRVVRSDGDVPE